jgi:hypothetical protein
MDSSFQVSSGENKNICKTLEIFMEMKVQVMVIWVMTPRSGVV